MTFNHFNLSPSILKALQDKGYQTPTPIQQQAIPAILSGKDVVASAETGTGKTAAFCIPILQKLSQTPSASKGIRTLILTPTRELALQIFDNLQFYGSHLSIKNAVIYGGVSQVHQVQAIRNGVDILVATPGRLQDLIDQKLLSLNALEFFVLDEADRMLDMGFINDIKRLIKIIPTSRQNIFFSATLPTKIQSLILTIMHAPIHINIESTKKKISILQNVYYVERTDKKELLKHLIHQHRMKNVIVFSRTKHGADKIAKDLNISGISAESFHGNKSQNARQRALTNFKSNTTRVLVATDIAARGIDIIDLPFVINFELPDSSETYTHRIGRTGRAGQTGTALSFCDGSERDLLHDINRKSSHMLTVVPHPFIKS